MADAKEIAAGVFGAAIVAQELITGVPASQVDQLASQHQGLMEQRMDQAGQVDPPSTSGS